MDEKPTPHYDIGEVNRLMREGKYSLTTRVRRHTRARRWDRVMIQGCVGSLHLADFHKSQRHHADPDRWLDIYRPSMASRRMYVKLTFDPNGELVILSFCRDGEAH